MRGLRLGSDPTGRVHGDGEGARYEQGPEPAPTVFCTVRFHGGNIREGLPVPNGILPADRHHPSGNGPLCAARGCNYAGAYA